MINKTSHPIKVKVEKNISTKLITEQLRKTDPQAK